VNPLVAGQRPRNGQVARHGHVGVRRDRREQRTDPQLATLVCPRYVDVAGRSHRTDHVQVGRGGVCTYSDGGIGVRGDNTAIGNPVCAVPREDFVIDGSGRKVTGWEGINPFTAFIVDERVAGGRRVIPWNPKVLGTGIVDQ